MSAAIALIDERDPVPVRARIGALLSEARTADIAVTRIRLSALDLDSREVARVERCRVLLGRLDAGTLLDAAEASRPDAVDRLRVLLSFLDSGRLHVRAAGMADWVPDFSVFDKGTVVTGLLGAHFFGAPYPIVGPSFTALVTEGGGTALLARRFAELWEYGHDVMPAIRDVLERAHAVAVGAALGGGRGDRSGSRA